MLRAIPSFILISPVISENSPVLRGVIKSITPFIETPVIPPFTRLPAFNRYSKEPSLGILPFATLKLVSPVRDCIQLSKSVPVQEMSILPVKSPYI